MASYKEKKMFVQQILEYGKQQKLREPRCISDRILLYIRYFINEVYNSDEINVYWNGEYYTKDEEIPHNHRWQWAGFSNRRMKLIRYSDDKWNEKIKNMNDYAMKVYNNHIRGEMKYTSCSPLDIAAAVVYIAGVMSDVPTLTQEKLANIARVSKASVAKWYKILKVDFNL